MKRILLAAAILFTTACDVHASTYSVECASPFSMKVETFAPTEVDMVTVNDYGTRVVLKDGRKILFSSQIACRVEINP